MSVCSCLVSILYQEDRLYFLYKISVMAFQGGEFVALKLSESWEHVGLLTR